MGNRGRLLKELRVNTAAAKASLELCTQASKRFADWDSRDLTGLELGVASRSQGIPCGIARAIRVQACDHAVEQFDADFRGELEHFFSKLPGTRHTDLPM